MAEDPPKHFLCPISLDVMQRPVMVVHNGCPFWFDSSSLAHHARTPQRDNNPLTNEPGFADAPRVPATSLQEEINASKWARTTDPWENLAATDSAERDIFFDRELLAVRSLAAIMAGLGPGFQPPGGARVLDVSMAPRPDDPTGLPQFISVAIFRR